MEIYLFVNLKIVMRYFGFRERLKKSYFYHFGVWAPPPKVIFIFLATRPIFEHFWKKVYFSLWKPPQNFKNWCWTCKMFGTLFKMLAILCKMTAAPRKMTAAPRKMTAAPRKMTAATHLMFAKDQRGGLRSPPGPQGTPPTPILEKTLVSRNDF